VVPVVPVLYNPLLPIWNQGLIPGISTKKITIQMTDRNREYILDLFKIVGTTSILVVDREGNLKRLHCPFKVVAIVNLPPLREGAIYYVEAVKMTLELKEVYIIEGKGYFIWYFKIV
jgi:hypothetical protein